MKLIAKVLGTGLTIIKGINEGFGKNHIAYEIINSEYILTMFGIQENGLYNVMDYRKGGKHIKDIDLKDLQGVIYNLDLDCKDISCFKRSKGGGCTIVGYDNDRNLDRLNNILLGNI